MSKKPQERPDPQASGSQTTRFERFKSAILNHPVVAVIVLVAVVVVNLAAFTEALSKLIEPSKVVWAALAPAWKVLYPSLPILLGLAGLAFLGLGLIGNVGSARLSITIGGRKERSACALIGIAAIVGAVVWFGGVNSASASSETAARQEGQLDASIVGDYSPVIQKCISDNKPAYVVETATYVTHVDHVGKERRESHRHFYTLRALRDFDNPMGQGFYDTFSIYGAAEAKWLLWRSGLVTEDTMPKSNYYSRSKVVPVSFSMKRGERRTIVLGADAVAKLPFTVLDHSDDPINVALPTETYSRTVYDNVPPQGSGYSTDCVGEVILIVESRSLSLQAATNGLRLDAGRRVLALNAVYTQNQDSSVLSASWVDVRPGERVLVYYTW